MPQEDDGTSKLHHPEEILWLVFPGKQGTDGTFSDFTTGGWPCFGLGGLALEYFSFLFSRWVRGCFRPFPIFFTRGGASQV
jgi:hypothetical protein